MLSYWEQQSFLRYDHIVIGSGIIGLSVAIEIKDLYPSSRILVLERGLLPTGASSRNAGFACMGSATELLDNLQHESEDEIVRLFELRKKGLEQLRQRLGDNTIAYKQNGSYELISEKETGAFDKIDHLNKILSAITPCAFRLANDKIVEFGFSRQYTRALIENNCEGEIDTGKMLRALTDMALQKGIEIKTGADVVKFEEEKDHVNIFIDQPVRRSQLVLQCRTLSICTNAFTKQLLPNEDVIPGRGQVLITKPIPGLKFKGIFHFDKGYYYFREIDGRVLFGGGRNLDFKTEETTDIALNEMIQADLDDKLKNIILPNTSFEIDQRWSGIMAFGATKYPVVKAFTDKVFGAFRMGGMGVALGTETARQLKDIIKEKVG